MYSVRMRNLRVIGEKFSVWELFRVFVTIIVRFCSKCHLTEAALDYVTCVNWYVSFWRTAQSPVVRYAYAHGWQRCEYHFYALLQHCSDSWY